MIKCVECKEFTKINCFLNTRVEKGDCFKSGHGVNYIVNQVESELYLINMDTFVNSEIGLVTGKLVSDIEKNGFRFVMKYNFEIKECI